MSNDAVLFPKLREHVIAELSKVGARMKRNGEEMEILCPFHNDSNPSLGVYVGFSQFPGMYHCWSCKANGHWNILANKLRLATYDYGSSNVVNNNEDPFALLSASLHHISPLKEKKIDVRTGLEPLPPGFKWRGYGKAFYESLNAKFWWGREEDMDWMHFPLTMNGTYVGYTICALKPREKGKPKYMTFADTGSCLFLYDHIKANMPIVIVEGHFDALRLLAAGIPVVAMFGTQSWSAIKRNYIIAKNPPKVLILMDGDRAGYEAAQQLFLDLRSEVPVDIMYLPQLQEPLFVPERNEYINEMDPGNMPEAWIQEVRNRIGIAA